MASITEAASQIEPKPWRWILVSLSIWNFLLAVFFPIQGNVLTVSEGFYTRSIWFSLLTEMIGLYPHVGYLLAWPLRRATTVGSSAIPWDVSGVGGISGGILVSLPAVVLGLMLASGRRWAGFVAAVMALVVAATQFQQVHFPTYGVGWWSWTHNTLFYGMGTGAFEKLIASLISALLALTLFRVLLREGVGGKTLPPHTPMDLEGVQRLRLILLTLLSLCGLLVLILTICMPANMSAYGGAETGFSRTFQLIALIPILIAAIGVRVMGGRFFVGLATGYAVFLAVVLYGTPYVVLAGTIPGFKYFVQMLVWIVLALCAGIVGIAISMARRNANECVPQGRFSLGVIVSLAFLVASLDACHLRFSGAGLRR